MKMSQDGLPPGNIDSYTHSKFDHVRVFPCHFCIVHMDPWILDLLFPSRHKQSVCRRVSTINCISIRTHSENRCRRRKIVAAYHIRCATQLPVRMAFIFDRTFVTSTMIGQLKLFPMLPNLTWAAIVICRIVRYVRRKQQRPKKVGHIWYGDLARTSSCHADSWKCECSHKLKYVQLAVCTLSTPCSRRRRRSCGAQWVGHRVHRVHRLSPLRCDKWCGRWILQNRTDWQSRPHRHIITIDVNFPFCHHTKITVCISRIHNNNLATSGGEFHSRWRTLSVRSPHTYPHVVRVRVQHWYRVSTSKRRQYNGYCEWHQ